MDKEAVQRLFADTAQVLQEQEQTILEQSTKIAALKESAKDQDRRDKALALAKQACIRGIIDSDIESVEKYAEDLIQSGKNFDVVEEALKMASAPPDFGVAESLYNDKDGSIDYFAEAMFQ